MNLQQRFVHWYDLDQGGFEEDIPFYLSLAQRTGSPVLELGCGSGRLVLALARAGYEVTGVDNLPTMLARAREKAQAAGPAVADRCHFLQADMRGLDLPGRFRLAIVAVNTCMHLADPQEQALVLAGAFQHLVPGGVLVLDLFHPHPAALAPGDGEVCLEKVLTDPRDGRVACKFVARRANYARQVIDTTFIYDETDPQGRVTRTAETFRLRYLHRPEAEAMLRAAGFEIEGLYGSYELDPYGDEGERMLFLASRR